MEPSVKNFIQNNSIEKRYKLSKHLLAKYPDRVPIIVIRAEICGTPSISRNKFMCPGNATFLNFAIEVRKQIPNLRHGDGLFVFLPNNIVPQSSTIMSEIYSKYKNEDGFLYITYSSENVFG